MISFFKEFFLEIKRLLSKQVKSTMTLGEFKTELEGKNKNELVNLLIQIGSDIDRTLPTIDNRKQIKQTYSKKTLIKAIMLLAAEKYKLGEQNGNIKRVIEEQKNRSAKRVLRRNDDKKQG